MARAAIFVIFGAFAFASSASAQSGNDELARQTFDHGTELYNAGQYAEAAAEYQRAYDLSPRALILLNISRAYERALEPGPAADALERYLADEPHPEDEAELRQRLARLRELEGNASPPPGGAPAEAPIHWRPLPMGPERPTTGAPQSGPNMPPPNGPPNRGRPPNALAPSANQAPPRRASDDAARAQREASATETPPPPDPAPPSGPNPFGVSSAVFGGVSVVLTLVGIGLGVSVQDNVDRLSRVCSRDGLCPPTQSNLIRDAWSRAEASNITGGLGFVLGAAAVIQLIVALSQELRARPAPRALRVDESGVGVAF